MPPRKAETKSKRRFQYNFRGGLRLHIVANYWVPVHAGTNRRVNTRSTHDALSQQPQSRSGPRTMEHSCAIMPWMRRSR